jgi:aminoglycoside 6-adenylyltransferase
MALDFPSTEIILAKISHWGEGRADVRLAILASSRANPHATVDRYSDYDVILGLTDIHPYFNDRSWLEAFGSVLVLYRDPLRRDYGGERFAYITQYENGLKIDFTLWSLEILPGIIGSGTLPEELDVGYRLLFDKDGQTGGLQPPTFRAHVPTPPSLAEYLEDIEVFFHEATYVAKHLARAELMPAKYNLDEAMKGDNLRRMLEWKIEIDHDWSLKPGAHGRFLKARLPPVLWEKIERTYVGSDIEQNWQAMFDTIEIFRETALEVGEALNYDYPVDLHKRVLDYLLKVKKSISTEQSPV